MNLAGGQLAADADDEDCTQFAGDFGFPLAGREAWVAAGEVFGMNKGDFFGQDGGDLGIFFAGEGLGLTQDGIDCIHYLFEKAEVTFVMVHDPFPVPLVHVDGVEVVEVVFVAADGVHVGIETLARLETIVSQDHTFPFGQGEDHLSFGVVVGLDLKANLSLDAI
ncbi:MAG: hypothetical protein BWY71_01880 [Planctomycetes bacterium ADurb.Bin412]|nr:MAG: hypothetical protein BWY71_01880 [Planctomycetes bacterium ADurb.Bin412]